MSIQPTGSLNERARPYLEAVGLPQNLQGELQQLREDLEELNPQNTNARTLSQHRRGALERRIESIFFAIEKVIHPPVPKTPSEIFEQQTADLQNIINRLPDLEPRQLAKLIKELGPQLAGKIYHAVWLFSDCPKQAEFAKELVKKDSSILGQRLPGLFRPVSDTILQQILQELNTEYASIQQQEAIVHLRAFALRMTQDSSVIGVRIAFEALPLTVQQMIQNELGLLGHFNSVNVEQCADRQQLLLDQFTLDRENQKFAAFNAFSEPMHTSHAQLKALFKNMPLTVQMRLPQPPYWGRGFQPDLYKTLGAHYDRNTGRTDFRVYAPNATRVELKLSAFGHTEHAIALVKGENGIWVAQTEHAMPGRSYHFMITGPNGGDPVKKVDPFAFGNVIHCGEVGRDDHESIVRDADTDFAWSDNVWLANRVNTKPENTPMTIYEVHVTSWKRKENGAPLSWRELALDLARYCREMGYTHIELMAALEHTQEVSMGYQITNYFSINSRMGTLEDFQFFVNYMHEQDLGIFIDWVPAHFALDKFSLEKFDGSPLLEDDNPNFAYHPTWGTYEFDFSKRFTKDFLASNMDFLLNKLHVDGLRIDAVWSMLNLDYDRQPGTRKNAKDGNINLHAKDFLRNCLTYAKRQYPGVLMMAEDSEGVPNLTRSPFERGGNGKYGLGFDMTWHMGFKTDIFDYMQKLPHERSQFYPLLTSTVKQVDGGPDIRPRGKVVLPFSHDECANGKPALQKKMPGNDFDRFANGRLLLAYQLLRGGGPTLDMMGNEILQSDEWHGRLIQSLRNPEERSKPSVQWEELDPNVNIFNHGYNRGAQESRKVLNHLLIDNQGLHDQTDEGFAWINAEDSINNVISFHRRNNGQQFACIFNTSGNDLWDYMIPLPNNAPELARLDSVREVYNTDHSDFGGGGRTNAHIEIVRHEGRPTHLKLRLPPFTAIVLEEAFTV